MKKLYLALLWHMHQPYYQERGVYKMPWVFLHAIKDYYDMPRYCELYHAKATFNLVPSLMLQLEDYARRDVADEFLQALRKNPETLAPVEIEALVPQLFMAQAEYMIAPDTGYNRLYNRYLKNSDPLQFSVQELRDLCVHYLLAWTGMQTRREISYVNVLLQKGGNYTEMEKQQLLDELQALVGRIISYYKHLQDKGKIEVSVTPFYHPILPLLIDLDSAKEALPEILMPKVPENFQGFSLDAELQVTAAVAFYEKRFGCKPAGMWPAEGSVSTAALHLMAKHGLRWSASDEDVLGGSLVKDLRSVDHRSLLYRKYLMETPHEELALFFRDKKLSDLIGFTYAHMNSQEAVNDFVSKLHAIYQNAVGDVIVPVILDGENAWEYYPDGAYPFFAEFYRQLTSLDWLEMRTMSEIVSDATLPAARLNEVRAGSWIYGSFSTWIGHAEKNRGWEVLSKAAVDIDAIWPELEAGQQAAVQEHLHIAQGSDWFWWYGDDHFTVQAGEYDSLFRTRLMNAYEAAGLTVPDDLYIPIKTGCKTGQIQSSTNFIAPVIDGRTTSFFEWMGAGLYDVTYDLGSMHHDNRILQQLLWGFGREYLYLRLNGDFKRLLNQDYAVEMELELDKKYVTTFEINQACTVHGDLINDIEAAVDDILEIKIPKVVLKLDDFEMMRLRFSVTHGGKLVERAPAYNYIEVEAGLSKSFNWMV